MTFHQNIQHRRTLRLQHYDYASDGAYFVTVCTQGKVCLFGQISDEAMVMNDAGRMIQEVWQSLPERFPGIILDEFVVMPNHVHFVIFLVGAVLAPPIEATRGAASSTPTLGTIIRAFKSITAIKVNRLLGRQGQPLWQRNYYERVVRNEVELREIRQYIHYNPLKWADDPENLI